MKGTELYYVVGVDEQYDLARKRQRARDADTREKNVSDACLASGSGFSSHLAYPVAGGVSLLLLGGSSVLAVVSEYRTVSVLRVGGLLLSRARVMRARRCWGGSQHNVYLPCEARLWMAAEPLFLFCWVHGEGKVGRLKIPRLPSLLHLLEKKKKKKKKTKTPCSKPPCHNSDTRAPPRAPPSTGSSSTFFFYPLTPTRSDTSER